MTLHPVHGLEVLRRSLATARLGSGLPGSLLLHGLPGVGKQRLALWIGQLLLCEAPGAEGPCDVCRSCRLALRLEHPDLHWYFPVARPKGVSGDRLTEALEAARGEALREVRAAPLRSTRREEPMGLYLAAMQTLRRSAQRRPVSGSRQVFVVAEAELLVPQESSPEAANALLKLLEEPPEGTHMVLTSSVPGRLLPTIRSRTLPVHVPPLPVTQVAAFLVERAGAAEDAARRAATLSQGSIGRALGFLPEGSEPGVLERLRLEALELLEAALAPRPGAGFAAGLGFPVAGARGLDPLLSALEEWLRDLAAAAAGVPERILDQARRDRLVRVVRERALHPADVARSLEPLEQARLLAAGNVNPQLVVAGLLAGLRRTLGGS